MRQQAPEMVAMFIAEQEDLGFWPPTKLQPAASFGHGIASLLYVLYTLFNRDQGGIFLRSHSLLTATQLLICARGKAHPNITYTSATH
eukprot:4317724-Pleurochrysis_carterae.AAC.1